MYKLNSAYYAVSTVKAVMAQETLRMISFSYVHCIMTHGIIFWGNLRYRINIIRIPPSQKKIIISIIINSSNRDSCRELVKNVKILGSQYIVSVFICSKKQSSI